jgi:hypothetical protein
LTLAYSKLAGKVSLGHIEASELPEASPDGLQVGHEVCLLVCRLTGIVIKNYNSYNGLDVKECIVKFKAAKKSSVTRENAAMARAIWADECSKHNLATLRELTIRFGFSVSMGEVRILNGTWYVTNSGLLGLAQRRRCRGIGIEFVTQLSDPAACRFVFKATVHKSSRSRAFVGYGDANPSNVSSLVRGAEMRVAETRAVNRALRKAYGIGLCSVEELGSFSGPPQLAPAPAWSNRSHASNSSSNGQPRLRDKLCLLIREYNLDPTLVKAYAADFCGTQTLSGASRSLVESFISHLSASAKDNRDALVCKLNSYAQPQEAKS